MRIVQSTLFNDFYELLHAFSTKEEGFSKYPYTGNNLAFHVDDDPLIVKRNHKAYANFLNYPYHRLVRMDQVHGNKIKVIRNDSDLQDIPQCDALITNMRQTPIMVMVADCIPILIYDPHKKAIAAVHAGRAGIFLEIVPKCIKRLEKEYNCKPDDMLIAVGPAIHECCYEVGEDVVSEISEKQYGYALKQRDNTYYLDLLAILKAQLKSHGIRETNIDISPLCTSCNNELFYSYRAEKNQCGRFSGLIMLK